MTLTHRLALTAMFASAAAFAQTSSPNTSTTSKYDPTRAPPSSTTTASTPSSTHETMHQTAKTTVKMSPSAVLSMIHQVNLDEIKMGKTAQSKAQNDKVKDYAKDMVDDHTALDKKLTDFVKDEGNGKLTLSSSQIPASKQKEMKHMAKEAEHKLSSATGATFDRDYAKAMLKGHDKVLSDLDAALPSLESNAKVHDLVSDARDKVKMHRDHAKDLLNDLEGTSATGGSGMPGHTSGSGMQGNTATTGRQDTTPQSVGGGATGATTGTRATDSTTVTPPNPGTTSPSATPPPAASTPSGSSGR
jgi:putative membrane protein